MRIKIIHDAEDDWFIPRPMLIGLGACLLVAVIACSITANMEFPRDRTEAIYMGYMTEDADTYRPIVEVAGVEYTSMHSQPVRDNSYIGEKVIISYNEGNMHDFVIEWEEEAS